MQKPTDNLGYKWGIAPHSLFGVHTSHGLVSDFDLVAGRIAIFQNVGFFDRVHEIGKQIVAKCNSGNSPVAGRGLGCLINYTSSAVSTGSLRTAFGRLLPAMDSNEECLQFILNQVTPTTKKQNVPRRSVLVKKRGASVAFSPGEE